MKWESKIVSFTEVAPDQLLANPLNARRHPARQRDALRASLDRIGWVAPVIVNQRTGMMVDGHARVEEALSAGLPTVPVLTIDVSPEDERIMLATFDPISYLAEYDSGIMAGLLDGMDGLTPELDVLLDGLLSDAKALDSKAIGGHADPDSIPEPRDRTITHTGYVWLLPSERGMIHRVMCGDSTDPSQVTQLMDGKQAQALITDPPYGIDYGDTVDFRRQMGKTQRPSDDSHVQNDGLIDATVLWGQVFPIVAEAMAIKSAFYCWSPPGDQQIDIGIALRGAGLKTHGMVIWSKSSFSFSRADHKYQHEPCFYGWLANGTHEWCGPNNETTIWQYDRPHSSPLHPTQKPVELIQRCVRNITSAPEQTILDPFLGSGTTLIAAELENRTCYGMELDRRYVDIICRRWQQLTGIMPELEGTNTPTDFLGTADQ